MVPRLIRGKQYRAGAGNIGTPAGGKRGARIGTRWAGKGQCSDTSRVFAPVGGVVASASRTLSGSEMPDSTTPDSVMTDSDLVPLLHRIADALERLAPADAAVNDLAAADAFVWHADSEWFEPVPSVNRVPLGLLCGIDRVRDILMENTERFAAGLPANNVLLWGARGTGKSALVKAAHAAVNEARPGVLVLIEIHREDIPSLPRLLTLVRDSARRCLLFCDVLSFDHDDTSY
jgi:hypothetical protein